MCRLISISRSAYYAWLVRFQTAIEKSEWFYPIALFGALGGVKYKSCNDAAFIKLNHEVFSAAVTKKAIVILGVSPRLHAIIYTGSPRRSKCSVNVALSRCAYVDRRYLSGWKLVADSRTP